MRQQQRVEAAELLDRVVDRSLVAQAPGAPHLAQRRDFVVRGRHGLGAEEEQILSEPLGHHRIAAARQGGVLQQHARGCAFHIDVDRQQRRAQRLEEAGRERPETDHARHR
jgi:hypothetical protein